jgi:hypothetical protein
MLRLKYKLGMDTFTLKPKIDEEASTVNPNWI